MNTMQPFFLLVGRASVFWLGAIGLITISAFVAGFARLEEQPDLQVDPIFIAAFGFSALAGWLAGAAIQEFLHTTLAAALPGVRHRIASGFVAAGLVVSVVIVALIALIGSTSESLPVLFAVSLGSYGLGGVLRDPLSNWVSGFNAMLVLLVVVYSRELARIAGDRPWMVVAVSLAVGVVSFLRLFARSTLRRKPFQRTTPLPGRFSLEKGRRYQQLQLAEDSPPKKGWGAGYLADNPWSWVRAAVHEAHGARGWKAIARSIGRAWGLGLLVLLYAWVDKADMSFGEALARSIHDALFRSPHVPQFGEKGGPVGVVWIVISAAVVVTALFAPVALRDATAYPLSRRQRARVLFRGGLFDGAIFLFIVAPALLAIGQLSGWLAGYELRFDFMPFFFRVLLISLVLMPLAHRGRSRLQLATRRKSEHTLIGVIFGICGFVAAVGICTLASSALFGSPVVELVALLAALIVSQLIYRRSLTTYYRTADLA